MAYNVLVDFMYEVGNGVGVFLPEDEQREFTPLPLPAIVGSYARSRGRLAVFLLRWQIRRYIRANLTPSGLRYADPFDQELAFPEDYFEGDLLVFLRTVQTLLKLAR